MVFAQIPHMDWLSFRLTKSLNFAWVRAVCGACLPSGKAASGARSHVFQFSHKSRGRRFKHTLCSGREFSCPNFGLGVMCLWQAIRFFKCMFKMQWLKGDLKTAGRYCVVITVSEAEIDLKMRKENSPMCV